MKTVVLLSGGLDSVTNLLLSKRNEEPVLALTADYGQKAARAEIQAAKRFSEWVKVPHRVLDLKWLGGLGGNALTGSEKLPAVGREDLDNISVTQQTANQVWVPNRNGVLIAAAAAFVETLKANGIVVGFNREEAVTFPDNSSAFLNAANSALEFSTRGKVNVVCHTLEWDKKEMVKWLRQEVSDFPYEWLWSCYAGEEKPCGTCESCQRHKRAVQS